MTSKVKGTEGIEFPDGTVQSTAAAFSKSTNPTGTCFKYPDGTMIFYGKTSFTPAAFTGSPNQWYSEVANPFTFPTPFVAVPTVQMGVLDGNVSGRSAYCPFANAQVSGINSAYLYSPAAANPGVVAQVTMTCIAWGRWK